MNLHDKCDNARGKRAAKRKRTRAVYHQEGYSMMTDLFSMRTAIENFCKLSEKHSIHIQKTKKIINETLYQYIIHDIPY